VFVFDFQDRVDERDGSVLRQMHICLVELEHGNFC